MFSFSCFDLGSFFDWGGCKTVVNRSYREFIFMNGSHREFVYVNGSNWEFSIMNGSNWELSVMNGSNRQSRICGSESQFIGDISDSLECAGGVNILVTS